MRNDKTRQPAHMLALLQLACRAVDAMQPLFVAARERTCGATSAADGLEESGGLSGGSWPIARLSGACQVVGACAFQSYAQDKAVVRLPACIPPCPPDDAALHGI